MRKRLASFLLATALTAPLAPLAGCAPKHAEFVHVDNVALGRVVVYRNGVAFYERRATVSGGSLTVSVPRERVDDFLKSLTVVDAITGKPLPVSIPREQTNDGPFLVMRLQLPNTTQADVVLTYVTESPAWKPSYRVVVGDKGKVMLEGWAIVDNTSGEDWKGVMVGVGSSSALSFKYDLWSVRQVQRETLASEDRFAVAPPTGVTPFGGQAKSGADAGPAVLTELGDDEIRRPAGHPGDKTAKRVADADTGFDDMTLSGGSAGVSLGGGGRSAGPRATPAPAQPSPAPMSVESVSSSSSRHRPTREHKAEEPMKKVPVDAFRDQRVAMGDSKMKQLSQTIARSDKLIVIDAFADGNNAGANERANDRANIVKNQLIDQGVAPSRIQIKTHLEGGNAERVRLVAQAAPPSDTTTGKGGKAAELDAQPVGESHFANPMPMTVEKGSSAMVSMVRSETAGDVVYLYDAESERGNARFAFRAVRFTNPTDSTLETGPVTVYGSERFIGEGLTEPIAPKSSAIVPFALDRQIVIDRDDSEADQLAHLVTLQRGVLTAEVQHIKREKLTITNRLPQGAKLFLRRTLAKGWTLLSAPPRSERVGDSQLFEVDLLPGEVKTVEIAQATPMERTLDLNADVTIGMMSAYVEAPEVTPALREQLRKVLDIHKRLVDLRDEQISLHRRLDEYRERSDELHGQIMSLQLVKTGGDLMSHLKDKMKDISDRIQKATIALVDSEEKLMLDRVQFQDAIAELTLPDVTQPTGAPPAKIGASTARSKQ